MEVRELGKSKWSEDFGEDDIDQIEGMKGKINALSGLVHQYGKQRKSVHWGDQVWYVLDRNKNFQSQFEFFLGYMRGLGKGVVQELNNDIKYTGKVVQGHVCYQLIGFFQTLIYISVCVRVCIFYPFSTLFSSPWFGVFYTYTPLLTWGDKGTEI